MAQTAERLDLSRNNGLPVSSAIGVLLAMHNNGTLHCLAPSCRQVHGSATLCGETRSSQRYRFARFAHLLSPKQKHTGFPTTTSTRIPDLSFSNRSIAQGTDYLLTRYLPHEMHTLFLPTTSSSKQIYIFSFVFFFFFNSWINRSFFFKVIYDISGNDKCLWNIR